MCSSDSSGCGCRLFYLLGAIPRATSLRHLRHGESTGAHQLEDLRGHDVYLGHTVLCVHHDQPHTLPHHVAQVPAGLYGKNSVLECSRLVQLCSYVQNLNLVFSSC